MRKDRREADVKVQWRIRVRCKDFNLPGGAEPATGTQTQGEGRMEFKAGPMKRKAVSAAGPPEATTTGTSPAERPSGCLLAKVTLLGLRLQR